MRFIPALRWVPVVGALALLVSCRDAQKAVSSDYDVPTPGEAGLYPALSVSATKAGTLASLRLVQVPAAVELASYQGELQFDATLLKLEEASFPDQVSGAVLEVSPGKVRFVGTPGAALGDAPLLNLRFAAGGEIVRVRVNVTFEEVTAAGDLADLTLQVKNGTLLLRKTD